MRDFVFRTLIRRLAKTPDQSAHNSSTKSIQRVKLISA
jgi:hypothetical protein